MRRTVPAERVSGLLGSGRGLASTEVRERRLRYGANDILEAPERAWWALARETGRDPMLWFLVATGGVYAALGQRTEAWVLLASLLPLVGMDAFLHRRSRASTAGLRSRLASHASVIRDGADPGPVDARELVPGDLVLVHAGEPFPADGLVEEGEEIQVDESALTGEAYPVRKRPLSAAAPTDPSVEDLHWGLAGTRLLTGKVRLRVVTTGRETLYGDIVRHAVLGQRARTPLQAGITSLMTVLLVAAAALCAVLAFVRLHQGFGALDALVSAMTLAVAALPEEFPVVFTMFLGVGVHRLARRRALVRRAVSVENIGRVTCICSDKTGTITQGELTLTHLHPAEGVTERELLALALLASRPDAGDPLDAAVAGLAAERDVSAAGLVSIATFPFTEDRRRESGVWREADGGLRIATKGSPEVILALTSLSPAERQRWLASVDVLAGEGHKVIACAGRSLASDSFAGGEPDRGFRFAGLLALEDPVRPGVREAVDACREAGIHVLMVTGDHPRTARAVARAIGLGDGDPAVALGEEMTAALERDEAMDLRHVHVIARAMPAHKLGIVRALQLSGEIVAVTGDGVNDVPALQAADIGVAMGERGTRSAREVASIVLLDDRFGTIVNAIGEGRQLFRNLQRSFAYLLGIHVPLVLSAALVPLAGYPLLYFPVHVVWLELVIHPSALLAFQAPAPALPLMALPRGGPRAGGGFFSRRQWAAIALSTTAVTALLVLAYVRSVGQAGPEHGRSMALAALTAASAGLVAVLSRLRTTAARGIAAGTVALTVLLVQTPSLAARLHLAPLDADDWAIAAGSALLACAPIGVLRARSRRRPGATPARGAA